MSHEEYAAIRAQEAQQAEWARTKPPIEELRDEIEELKLETADLRESSRRDTIGMLSVLMVLGISLLWVLFGME